MRGAVDFFQFAIQRQLLFGAHFTVQRGAQFRVQRQYGGQGAVAVDQGVQGIGVQRQLLIGADGVFLQRLAFGVADGQSRGEGGTGDDQQGVERQAYRPGSRKHGRHKQSAIRARKIACSALLVCLSQAVQPISGAGVRHGQTRILLFDHVSGSVEALAGDERFHRGACDSAQISDLVHR